MTFTHGYEVTVERPAGWDQHGVPYDASTHVIKNCTQGQLQSVETVDGAQVVVAGEKVFCDDLNADVQDVDVLVMPNGDRWQVSGAVYRPVSPFSGFSGGCVIPVERAAGAKQPAAVPENS